VGYAHVVKPGQEVKLADIDPDDTHGVSHQEGQELSTHMEDRLGRLQRALYAAGQSSILIVLQGLDTAGKDGTINHVMTHFNPAGCRVESFKAPNPVEAAHDFLWRVHRVTPPKGVITIFNRSYYEDVLVVRVHDLVPKHVWGRRYERINEFEALLTDNGTTILKFFLYISKHEQRDRLKAREHDPKKAWKLSISDWAEHDLYDGYLAAYDDALTRCSTQHAPWHIIPANHKWFRNLAVAQTIVDRMEPAVSRWEWELTERGKKNLAAVAGLQVQDQPKA
jgi:PPK2 family polyphosphate:nucleotide phosphotransferase